eukprot:CAMPEP_0205865400 /NCGR_PEP_ID=MMETSP1083-20121108/7866_1 /ASSEMBLY_ACC=CAM_ASM_000430 /TAXON_ID=97485 /ORGANISM="Prymnesium parvum, Strain Texoma1" /LENGTH=142 /DNA_ID=CAMNT_0053227335 /DNA_START=319 /DNA_END=742 /DNA_ORIENTATION=+
MSPTANGVFESSSAEVALCFVKLHDSVEFLLFDRQRAHEAPRPLHLPTHRSLSAIRPDKVDYILQRADQEMYVLIHAHPDEDVRRHDGALTHGRLALENRQEHLVDLVVKPLRLHRHPDRPLHRPLKAIGGLQHVPLHLLVR